MPKEKLNEKIKTIWRISAIIYVLLIAACVLVTIALILPALASDYGTSSGEVATLDIVFICCAIATLIAFIAFVIVIPPIRYIRWRYDVGSDEVDILKGIIWKQRVIIPLVRVQNVDTRQGPILRAMGLASITVSTAAGSHEIPGLLVKEADELRDKVAVLVKLAKEDV